MTNESNDDQQEPTLNDVMDAINSDDVNLDIQNPYEDPIYSDADGNETTDSTLRATSRRITWLELNSRLVKFDKDNKDLSDSEEVKDARQEVVGELEALGSILFNDGEFNDTFDRIGSEWRQEIDTDNGTPIKITSPRMRNSGGGVISGDQAINFLTGISGVGAMTRIPLWHTGIVVTMDSFTEDSLLELNVKIGSIRSEAGRDTKGATFTGDDVLIVGVILDFILKNITNTTISKKMSVKELRDIILVSDIPSLIVGALQVIYPKGYPLYHPCTNVITEQGKPPCEYAVEGTPALKTLGDYKPDSNMSFKKTLWIDKTLITEEAIEHMSASDNSHHINAVRKYQKALNLEYDEGCTKVVMRNDVRSKITVYFKTANITSYITEGTNWVNGIAKKVNSIMVNSVVTDPDKKQLERQGFMFQYTRMMELLKQSSWVSHIEIIDKGDGNSKTIVNDEKSVKRALAVISNFDGGRSKFKTAVLQYKETANIAFTGLPNYTCPGCGNSQTDADSSRPTLIPLNMVGYFFTIMEWRALTRMLKE